MSVHLGLTWHHRDDKLPEGNGRVFAFSPDFPSTDPHHIRVMAAEFVKRSTDVKWWAWCWEGIPEMEDKKRSKLAEEREHQYWISPKGVPRKYSGSLDREIVSIHYEIAHSIYPEVKYPGDYLMRSGWICVGSTAYGGCVIDREPTQAQINYLDREGLLKSLSIKKDTHYVRY